MILWTAAQSSHFPAKMITNKLPVRGIAYLLCIFYAETSTLVKAHLKGGGGGEGGGGEENSLGYEFSWCLLLLYSPPDNYCTVVVCFILGIQSPRIALFLSWSLLWRFCWCVAQRIYREERKIKDVSSWYQTRIRKVALISNFVRDKIISFFYLLLLFFS